MAQFSVDIHLYPRVYQPVSYCIRVQNKNISTIGRVLKKKKQSSGFEFCHLVQDELCTLHRVLQTNIMTISQLAC